MSLERLVNYGPKIYIDGDRDGLTTSSSSTSSVSPSPINSPRTQTHNQSSFRRASLPEAFKCLGDYFTTKGAAASSSFKSARSFLQTNSLGGGDDTISDADTYINNLAANDKDAHIQSDKEDAHIQSDKEDAHTQSDKEDAHIQSDKDAHTQSDTHNQGETQIHTQEGDKKNTHIAVTHTPIDTQIDQTAVHASPRLTRIVTITPSMNPSESCGAVSPPPPLEPSNIQSLVLTLFKANILFSDFPKLCPEIQYGEIFITTRPGDPKQSTELSTTWFFNSTVTLPYNPRADLIISLMPLDRHGPPLALCGIPADLLLSAPSAGVIKMLPSGSLTFSLQASPEVVLAPQVSNATIADIEGDMKLTKMKQGTTSMPPPSRVTLEGTTRRVSSPVGTISRWSESPVCPIRLQGSNSSSSSNGVYQWQHQQQSNGIMGQYPQTTSLPPSENRKLESDERSAKFVLAHHEAPDGVIDPAIRLRWPETARSAGAFSQIDTHAPSSNSQQPLQVVATQHFSLDDNSRNRSQITRNTTEPVVTDARFTPSTMAEAGHPNIPSDSTAATTTTVFTPLKEQPQFYRQQQQQQASSTSPFACLHNPSNISNSYLSASPICSPRESIRQSQSHTNTNTQIFPSQVYENNSTATITPLNAHTPTGPLPLESHTHPVQESHTPTVQESHTSAPLLPLETSSLGHSSLPNYYDRLQQQSLTTNMLMMSHQSSSDPAPPFCMSPPVNMSATNLSGSSNSNMSYPLRYYSPSQSTRVSQEPVTTPPSVILDGSSSDATIVQAMGAGGASMAGSPMAFPFKHHTYGSVSPPVISTMPYLMSPPTSSPLMSHIGVAGGTFSNMSGAPVLPSGPLPSGAMSPLLTTGGDLLFGRPSGSMGYISTSPLAEQDRKRSQEFVILETLADMLQAAPPNLQVANDVVVASDLKEYLGEIGDRDGRRLIDGCLYVHVYELRCDDNHAIVESSPSCVISTPSFQVGQEWNKEGGSTLNEESSTIVLGCPIDMTVIIPIWQDRNLVNQDVTIKIDKVDFSVKLHALFSNSKILTSGVCGWLKTLKFELLIFFKQMPLRLPTPLIISKNQRQYVSKQLLLQSQPSLPSVLCSSAVSLILDTTNNSNVVNPRMSPYHQDESRLRNSRRASHNAVNHNSLGSGAPRSPPGGGRRTPSSSILPLAYNTGSRDFAHNTGSRDFTHNTGSGEFAHNTGSRDFIQNTGSREFAQIASRETASKDFGAHNNGNAARDYAKDRGMSTESSIVMMSTGARSFSDCRNPALLSESANGLMHLTPFNIARTNKVQPQGSHQRIHSEIPRSTTSSPPTKQTPTSAWQSIRVTLVTIDDVQSLLSPNTTLFCKVSLGTTSALKANLTNCLMKGKSLPRFDFALKDESVLKVCISSVDNTDGSKLNLCYCKLNLHALIDSDRVFHKGCVPLIDSNRHILGHLDLSVRFSMDMFSGVLNQESNVPKTLASPKTTSPKTSIKSTKSCRIFLSSVETSEGGFDCGIYSVQLEVVGCFKGRTPSLKRSVAALGTKRNGTLHFRTLFSTCGVPFNNIINRIEEDDSKRDETAAILTLYVRECVEDGSSSSTNIANELASVCLSREDLFGCLTKSTDSKNLGYQFEDEIASAWHVPIRTIEFKNWKVSIGTEFFDELVPECADETAAAGNPLVINRVKVAATAPTAAMLNRNDDSSCLSQMTNVITEIGEASPPNLDNIQSFILKATLKAPIEANQKLNDQLVSPFAKIRLLSSYQNKRAKSKTLVLNDTAAINKKPPTFASSFSFPVLQHQTTPADQLANLTLAVEDPSSEQRKCTGEWTLDLGEIISKTTRNDEEDLVSPPIRAKLVYDENEKSWVSKLSSTLTEEIICAEFELILTFSTKVIDGPRVVVHRGKNVILETTKE